LLEKFKTQICLVINGVFYCSKQVAYEKTYIFYKVAGTLKSSVPKYFFYKKTSLKVITLISTKCGSIAELS